MKKNYITVLNVLACFMVVMLHVNGDFWEFSFTKKWIFANAIESLAYFAVPVFFMISGANLIDYRNRYSTRMYIKKRIKKVVIPFIGWSIMGIIASLLFKSVSFGMIDFKFIIDGIFNSKIVEIYWFFIPLITVYLAIPIYSLIPVLNRKKAYMYMIAWAMITISILPLCFKILKIKFNNDISAGVVGGYCIYALIGYLIDHYKIKKRKIFIIIGILGLGIHFFGTWYLSYKIGEIDTMFKGYLNIPTVMYSVTIYYLFKEFVNINNPKIINKLNNISNATFGIYLIHIYIIRIIEKILHIRTSFTFFKLIETCAVFIVSYLIIYIMKKIPIIKELVP